VAVTVVSCTALVLLTAFPVDSGLPGLHSGSCSKNFIHAHKSKLYLADKEYREIGFNFYQAFRLYLNKDWDGFPGSGGEDFARNSLRDLSKHKFKIIRIMTLFHKNEFEEMFFDDDPEVQKNKRVKFFNVLDNFLNDCDRLKIKVILPLFWNLQAISHLNGREQEGEKEIADAISGFNSLGYRKFEEFSLTQVARYKDRPTIAFWEIGNEYDLYLVRQLPDGSKILSLFFENIISKIRSIDKNHLISTGNSEEVAWYVGHNLNKDAKTAKLLKLIREHEKNIIRHHGVADVISTHYYINDSFKMPWYSLLASRVGKPLVVGEFGPYFKDKKSEKIHANYNEQRSIVEIGRKLNEIVDNEIPLSLLWNYDCRSDGEADFKLCFGITDEALRMIEEVNIKIKKRQ
ncbi:MAG: cellulase family glycosylhydrolase, partial [Patescibacteria group bacterium]